MDDIVTRTRPRISAAEMQRRRRIVRAADANNRLEGVYRGAETDAAVDAYVRGEIEVTDMVALFKAQPAPQ